MELGGRETVLDGELVVLGPDGRSLFNELLHRHGSPPTYLSPVRRSTPDHPLGERVVGAQRSSAPGNHHRTLLYD